MKRQKTFCDIWVQMNFLNWAQKALTMREKTGLFGYII